jgi:NADH-quinone oxidoreductase subunit M
MAFLQNHLLSWILFTPALAAVVILFFPKEKVNFHRWFAFVASLVPLALSIWLWVAFNPNAEGFQFQEQARWFTAVHSTYHLGVDGIALAMVLLTTLLTSAALLASFSIEERVKTYMVLFLLMETGMLGVFMALDLVFFYVFWEVSLIPMFFLISQWGSEKGVRFWGRGREAKERDYAAFKFLLYTMAGSLGLLAAIFLLGMVSGSFDLPTVLAHWKTVSGALWGIPVATIKAIVFWAFVIAFAIKVPVWPFHTWLPDAHTAAPTPGSMILAGVMLKLGAFGFLRFILPLYPEQAKIFAGALAFLGMMSIVMGAFASFGQTDFKRLVAYSSVNHMGFVILGIAAAAYAASADPTTATIALNGAVLQMFNHGLSAAGMFFLVGVIYERAHTRDLREFGGLWPLVPVYGGILLFTSMASLGLPGLNGFVSEFLVVRGSWPVFTLYTALSMLGLLFTGAYILKGLRDVLQGPLNTKWVGHLTDISVREIAVIAPLMVLMLWIGVWPMWILNVINKAAVHLLALL